MTMPREGAGGTQNERQAGETASRKGRPVMRHVRAASDLPLESCASGPVVFFHIPKAGGLTLDYVFRAINVHRKEGWHRFLGTLYGQYLGEGKAELANALAGPEAKECLGKRFLVGHIPFEPLDALGERAVSIALLRDPIARSISHFRFGASRGGWATDSDPAELYRAGLMVDNPQVRQLSGCKDARMPCDDAMLAEAIRNAEQRIDFAGPVERFDALLSILISVFDWPEILYRPINQARPDDGTDPLRLAEAFRRFNQLDQKLYDRVAGGFEPRMNRFLRRSPAGRAPKARSVLVTFPELQRHGQAYPLLTQEEFGLLRKQLAAKGLPIEEPEPGVRGFA